MRHLTVKELEKWLKEEYLVLSAQANLDSINFLKQKIQELEKAIRKKVKLNRAFHNLKTVPGIGDILALTIMLEVGDIIRFPKSVISHPIADACRPSDCPMVKAKDMVIVKTVIGI